ncbi:MAG: hypothetical protein FJ304_15085 [Planctomycetes bacterium]|nr:hypothetical protein [Planctomycetota bacterium]
MPAKPTNTNTGDGGALAAALRAVLDGERDPRARRWLRALIAGDDDVKAKRKPRRKRAAA